MKIHINCGTAHQPDNQTVEIWKIEDRCVQIPCHTAQSRGTWLATVYPDRREFGGLHRDFWVRGEKGWAVIPPLLQVGMYIESGVKYGEKPRKEYFRLLSVQPHQLVLRTSTKPSAKPPDIQFEIEQVMSAIDRTNLPVELLLSNPSWN